MKSVKYLMYTLGLSFILLFASSGISALKNGKTTKSLQVPQTTDTGDPKYSPPISHAEWKGMRILHIGDSHLANWGLKSTLRKRFRSAGASYSASAWIGSSSRSWLITGRLRNLLREKSPHVVIVNLGINIIKAKSPNAYAKYVKKIVKKISPRKCYWVAPPLLIEDKNGLYDMLKEASKPCIFLDSRKIHFDVVHKKNFHLSKSQSAKWAEKIWKWMNDPSLLPGISDGI